MLTGHHLLFVGGDARQLEVISQVTELDGSATLVGFENLNRNFIDSTYAKATADVFKQADALILPIAGTDDSGTVMSQFCENPIVLTKVHFSAMSPGSYVFTGIARPYLEEQCEKHGLRLVKLMELDEVAILNSIPTAEGAISMAMQHTDITLHGSNCMVLGFGRCGHTLARTLSALGAQVKVAARKPAHLARIAEMGLEPVVLAQLDGAIGNEDVIFNTIPYPVLTAGVLKDVKSTAVIIDIASKPGGTDFRYAERRRLKAVLAPSLPGLVAPKTAGRIIANTLSRLLVESEEREE